MDEPGLRERKRQATREALRVATLRLTVLRGWDQVRVEDIAAEAGVSTRTFNNDVASREEVALRQARLNAPTPALVGEQFKAHVVIERTLARAVARRIGVDVEQDINPQLVASAAVSATRVAFGRWNRTGSEQPLRVVLRDADDLVRPNWFTRCRRQQTRGSHQPLLDSLKSALYGPNAARRDR